MTLVGSSDLNAHTASQLCELLMNVSIQNSLGLYENHPLVQQALLIQAQLSQTDEKNPFIFYQMLKNEEAHAGHLQPIFREDVRLENIISLPTLRSRGVNKPFTFGDLGVRVTYTQVKDLFDQLKLRLINAHKIRWKR